MEWSLNVHAELVTEVASAWVHPSPDLSSVDYEPLLVLMSSLLDNSKTCVFLIRITIDLNDEVGVSVVNKIVSFELPHLVPS